MERIIKGKITENITEDVSINYEEEFHRYHHKIDDFKKLSFVYSMMKGEGIEPSHLLEKSGEK
jgi:hypothetical protein